MYRVIFLASIYVFCLSYLIAQDDQFMQANNAYNESNFKQSIQLYEEILSNLHESPDLYLNLGNAYLKSGKLGTAILNYEKGLKLSGNHEALNQNLKYARKQIKTPITAIPDFFLSRYWNNLIGYFGSGGWAFIQIVLFLLMAITISFWFLGKTLNLKKYAFFSLVGFAFLLVISLVAGTKQRSLERNPNQAIVVSNEAKLLTGASDQSDLLINLSEGVKLKLLDQIENYYKVELLDKEVGWISEEDIKPI